MRHASDSKFAIARITRPAGFVTRAISAIAAAGSSKWSMAPLQKLASKVSSAKGKASPQPRTQVGSTLPVRSACSCASPVMR